MIYRRHYLRTLSRSIMQPIEMRLFVKSLRNRRIIFEVQVLVKAKDEASEEPITVDFNTCIFYCNRGESELVNMRGKTLPIDFLPYRLISTKKSFF